MRMHVYIYIGIEMGEEKQITEIGNARALSFDFSGDTEDGSDGGERRRNDLVVEHLRRERSHGSAARWPSRQSLLLPQLRHCLNSA